MKAAVNTVSPARCCAVDALLSMESTRQDIRSTIESVVSSGKLSSEDRALLNELVYGVLRHRLYLDWALQQVAREEPYTQQPMMRQILRVGAFQLLMLDRVPDYAAVDQSVELVKARLSPKHGALANALLRELAKRRPVLAVPDLLSQPLEHIAIKYSHPRWLVKRWLKRFGAQRTMTLCRFNNEPAPLTIRTNRLKLSLAEYQKILQDKGIHATPCDASPFGLQVEHRGPITELPGYGLGWFYVQDEASQIVPLLLAPRRGDAVLDVCAAPGGKTTQIAEMIRNEGMLVAIDRVQDRLALVEDNCRRLGITAVQCVLADATEDLSRLGRERFDRILVDAPCAGFGVLRRHPEGKWLKDEGSIRMASTTATMILKRVSSLLKPKGVLVYSTCSTEPEENSGVVEAFLAHHRQFKAEDPRPLLPAAARSLINERGYFSSVLKGRTMDGFFAARLVKTG